jgi:hypothetical protein
MVVLLVIVNVTEFLVSVVGAGGSVSDEPLAFQPVQMYWIPVPPETDESTLAVSVVPTLCCDLASK